MSALTLQRTSAAKAGWIIGLLFFAWLAFLFVPAPWTAKPPPPAPAPPAPSRLRVAGLKDNPDWDGLPELFAISSPSADWQNDRAQFAYWHPGSHSYAYLFEAVRKDGKIRFRTLSKAEAFTNRAFEEDGSYIPSDAATGTTSLVEPTFERESPTHPFVFFRDVTYRDIVPPVPKPGFSNPVAAPARVKVEPGPMPKVDPKDLLAPNDPKKK